jgi:hypothetical protein
MAAFLGSRLPVDSVLVSEPLIDAYSYLQFKLQVFPHFEEERFNRTGVSYINTMLNRQSFPLEGFFGPYYFLEESYEFSARKKSSKVGVIVGATIGSFFGLILLVCVGLYVFRQKKRAEIAKKQSAPFASWDPNNGSGSVPQLQGARSFTFDEIKKCTNNLSDLNIIGSGGYGKVYKATISSGQVVAIKRAQQGSVQGATEFKTEIELLSRIHHKNVVSLVGFCYEQGEQMLVYEFVSNGTLKDNLSGNLGMRLNWIKRLKAALDSARGLSYLHELANPPIIHRDVKSTNILLDDNFNAKVADFGLSKLLGDTGKGYVTTQVKGTLGYMDPEYYMTQQVTDKSDVYSFGVVLLELVTARAPIHQGKYIVKEVQAAMDKSKTAYGLHEILDPALGLCTRLVGLERFVDLAMSCVGDSGPERPAMGEVVREMESIIQLATSKANPDSGSTLSTNDGKNLYEPQNLYEPFDDGTSSFDRSSVFVPFHTESR